MKVEITKVTIVQGPGSDYLMLETTLPEGSYPWSGKAMLSLSVASDNGPSYVQSNFPDVPCTLVKRVR